MLSLLLSPSATEAFLLYSRVDTGEVGFVVVNEPKHNDDVHLVGYSSTPVGVAYDPVTQVSCLCG